MAIFVLVHGFGGGGWYWRDCANLLEAAGHKTFTPTLSGIGDRSHIISPATNLETHIEDATNLMIWEDLQDVVLVGHSYGGAVISGAGNRVRARIGLQVYLDAFILEDGLCVFDLQPPERREFYEEIARKEGYGWLVPPPPSKFWKIKTQEMIDKYDELMTPHPLACLTQKLEFTDPAGPPDRRAYIWARDFTPSPFEKLAARVRDEEDWIFREITGTGHMAMTDDSGQTADILLGLLDA